jgi:oligoribonuclease
VYALGGHESRHVALGEELGVGAPRGRWSGHRRESTRDSRTDIVRRVAASPAALPAVDDRLVWIDLEMTGLDVERDVIVEIACIVTDASLCALDDGIQIVVHADGDALAAMSDFVREMHTKSGLMPEIERSPVDVAGAQQRTLEYVKQHVPAASSAPLCGNSIGTDRRFLARYMPLLDDYLHYRSIDVSSLKELCRRWYPDVYRKRPGKAEHHRALVDIRESIEELRFYRANLLRAPDAPVPSAQPAS